MSKRRRIIFYSLFGIIVLTVFILLITANSIVKNKLENILQNELPENVTGKYENISVSTFTGSLSIKKPFYIIKNEEDGKDHTFIGAEEIKVGNVNYIKLLFNDELIIGKISFDRLLIKHYKDLFIKSEEKKKPDLTINIHIKKVLFVQSGFEVYEGKSDSLSIAGNDIDLTIEDFEVNDEIIQRKIPIEYKDIQSEGGTVFIKTSTTENISIENYVIKNDKFKFNNIKYHSQNTKSKNHFDLDINSLTIENFDFESFEKKDFFIKSEGITFDSPNFIFYNNGEKQENRKLENISIKDFPFNIEIDSFKIKQATAKIINIFENSENQLQLQTANLSLALEHISLNTETLKNKIPFDFQTVFVNADSIFVRAGDYENLTIEKLKVQNKDIEITDLLFKTKYSRAELSRIIPVERDHYNISVPSLFINNFDHGFKEENFFTDVKKITLTTPNVDIYRDKLVRDDNSFKPLYSRSLRELPFNLTVDSVRIKDAYIQYTERTHSENNGGIISFKNFNAKISDAGNTHVAPNKTQILVDALFMDHAPLKADWSFNVQNKNDAFVFKAELSNFDVKQINRFTEANIRTRVDGFISKTYFTIDGNNENSKTDMKIKYSDLKVDILKKDSKETRRFLTGVANLFLRTKDIGKEGFRDGTGETERSKTQSVFNQLWISAQSALKKTII